MEIENVTRICFTSWRTAEQQGKLTIGNGLLGKVIIDDQGMLAAVAEELAHGNAGVRCDELQRCRLGSGCSNNDGVIHGAVLGQLGNNLGNRGTLLADSDIDTDNIATLLVDDRIDGNSGLAGLTVADDQLALAAPDWNHGVDRLEAGCHRLMNRFTVNDAGGLDLDLAEAAGVDRRLCRRWADRWR